MRSKRLRNLIDYSVYVAARLVVCIVQAMPVESCVWLARLFTVVAWSVLRIRRDVIDENLSCAFPEWTRGQRRAVARQMWEHLFLFLLEIVHAPRKIRHTNWRNYVTLVNAKLLLTAFFDDRPTVLLCGHYGNFEVSGYVLGVLGFPTYTVARTLDNPYLDRYVNQFRSIGGQHILPKSGSSPQVEEVLKRGGILALLVDQNAGPKGCWVNFLGRPASSHKAIALFSLASDAHTLFCYARRRNGPLTMEVGATEVLDPRTMPREMRSVSGITEWFTRQLEDTIRQAPQQYWWLHRRWKDTRVKKSPASRQAA